MIKLGTDKFDLKCPETIYVIGSGPSLKYTHDVIPQDAYRVYLNGAIMVDNAKPDIWFGHCQTVPKNDWWMTAYKKYHNISFFGTFITNLGFPSKYYFDFYNDLPKYKVIVGTTVAGIAMQLFPYFGAKKVILVGIDMTSNFRFDGSYNPENNTSKEQDQIKRINYVIDRADCTYESLGPTRFNIEEIKY